MEKKVVKKGSRVLGFKGSRVESKKLKAQGSKGKDSILWPFILGCCDMGSNYSVNVKELYDHYRDTLTIKPDPDAKHSLSFKDFEEELKKALPFVDKEKRRPERRMYFTGIRMKRQAEGCRLKANSEDAKKSDVVDAKTWASSSIKHVPSEVVKELADDINANRDNEIVKHIVTDFKSNDMLKEPMEKGQAGVKSPIELMLDSLESQINALNDGIRALGIRVIPVSACDDEISNIYPADFEVKDMMPDNSRSRIFNRLDLLLSKVAWIATVQKRIEELLEI